MLDIKVLGPGCANCQKVEAIVRQVIEEQHLQANVEKVTDYREYPKYGLLMTPGLWVNGALVYSGKIPAKSMVERWLLDASQASA